MKLYTYQTLSGEQRIGAQKDLNQLVDLAEAEQRAFNSASGHMASMQALIDSGEKGLDLARKLLDAAPIESLLQLDELDILSPLPVPTRLRDGGFFLEHMENISRALAKMAVASDADNAEVTAEDLDKQKFPLQEVFYRRVLYYNGNHHSVIGHNAPFKWPEDIEVVDYELELAVVVGQSGYKVSPESAPDFVFGYTLMNDWSARDLQIDVYPAGAGPCMGKDLNTSLGPCIVTKDEIPDPHNLEMTTHVDGEQWSRGFTKNMYHNIFEGLSQMSHISPLVAGEVVGTGTPVNGSGLEQGKKLQRGNRVELYMAEIGALANTIEG